MTTLERLYDLYQRLDVIQRDINSDLLNKSQVQFMLGSIKQDIRILAERLNDKDW
jgi:hypothetical protein